MGFSIRRWRIVAMIAATVVFGLYYFLTTPQQWAPTNPVPVFKNTEDDTVVHWSKLPELHPVTSMIPMPTGKPKLLPKIQAKANSEDAAAKKERESRQAKVKESFVHSWTGYKKQAWLRDEVIPIAGGYRDTFGGWAATLVDSLDTLWIMGMKEDFEAAVSVINQIDFTTTETQQINVFETTIRYLGGFLAAYDISGHKYPILLTKATEVGEMLMSVFDTPNRMPITRWDWKKYMQGKGQFAPQQMLVSEIGSLSLEFTRLAQLTGDNKFYDAIARIGNVFEESQNKTKLPGMWPVVIDAGTPDFTRDSGFTLGGMSDSLYEYLPKQYMMLGGLLAQPRNLYEGFIEVAKKYMFFRPLNPENKDILVAGDVRSAGATTTPILDPKGQHLTCFTGGMLAIASKIFDRPQDLPIASKLTEGCVWAYDSQVTGIAPEIYSLVACTAANDDCKWEELRWHNALVFNDPSAADAVTYEEKVKNVIENGRLKPGFTAINDRRYILRPEAIESVFIMYRVTGDVAWQDKAWRMFQKIEAATRTGIASSAIDDVTKNKPSKLDSMESFWLAETLKYFYLIFSDTELVSLDKYVLNTEAHPLLRPA